MTDRVFDRIPRFDERSRQYPIRTLLPARKPRSYTWGGAPHLDQGEEGACVGHGWAHEVAANPNGLPVTSKDAFAIYKRAQQIDDWEGEEYSGTSVLAGAKAVAERGWMAEYRWAFTLDDALSSLAWAGPIVIGVNWYEGMTDPNSKGYLKPSGELLGGHCVMVKGLNVAYKRVIVHNSWGTSWGRRGDAYLSFTDFGRLQRESGEVCVPVKRK